MVRGPVRSGLARFREDQSRYRWYALGVTTFTQSASSAVTSALGPLAPLLMAQFTISRGEVGLVQTAVYLSATWSALVGGRLADRVGERSVLIVSGLITGAGAIAAAFAGPFWAFLGAAFILGLGTGVQNPAGSAAVIRWFPPRRRGFARRACRSAASSRPRYGRGWRRRGAGAPRMGSPARWPSSGRSWSS